MPEGGVSCTLGDASYLADNREISGERFLKKVSIIDVAKHAGVSVSTVSLVLRQKGKISEATIGKVNAAITTLGYVHNVAAANLRANTSNNRPDPARLQRQLFHQVMASIVQELEKQGYMVFLGQPLNDGEHLERTLLSFKQQGVAGVIYLASDTAPPLFRNTFVTARCRLWRFFAVVAGREMQPGDAR